MKELREILLKNIEGKITTIKGCNLDKAYYEEKDMDTLRSLMSKQHFDSIESLKKELNEIMDKLDSKAYNDYQLRRITVHERVDEIFNKHLT